MCCAKLKCHSDKYKPVLDETAQNSAPKSLAIWTASLSISLYALSDWE